MTHTVQMILCVETYGTSLREDIIGWDRVEDPTLFNPQEAVGLTPLCHDTYKYKNVLHALWDGWKLLGPPQEVTYQSVQEKAHTWWLVKEKKVPSLV